MTRIGDDESTVARREMRQQVVEERVIPEAARGVARSAATLAAIRNL
jgi:hypothetical protein